MIIVALDFPTGTEAMDFADKLDPELCRLKVGLELFTNAGKNVVNWLRNRGFDVFLDLKLFDIPNTVERTCKQISDLGVWATTIHAMGGHDMLRAARRGLEGPMMVANTVLTSADDNDMYQAGIYHSAYWQSLKLANLAAHAGADGFTCSVKVAPAIKKAFSGDNKWLEKKEIIVISPGIRLFPDCPDDQKQVATAKEATRAGVDHIVLGRSILSAEDPMLVLKSIAV